ncbi:MAG: hypothetical protein KAG64_00175 [Bacteroidales bacterium]|nr:hypothetical protein [Bacteroidales bacterium]
MNKYIFISILLIVVALITNCKKEYTLGSDPTVDEVEHYVRKTNDSRAVFSYKQYEELLTELQKDRYVVLPINQFRSCKRNDSLVVVGLRHDIDWHPFKALEMARLEQDFGLSSTWYILPTAPYFAKYSRKELNRFSSMLPIYKSIENSGCEIGIHNDLLTVMVTYKMDPKQVNSDDISFLRRKEIQIFGSAAHGSTVAQKAHVVNFEMYSNFTNRSSFSFRGKVYPLGSYSLQQYGFYYEAYHVDHDLYFSDVGGVWNVSGGSFKSFMKTLKNIAPGKKVQILVHPVWWKK